MIQKCNLQIRPPQFRKFYCVINSPVSNILASRPGLHSSFQRSTESFSYITTFTGFYSSLSLLLFSYSDISMAWSDPEYQGRLKVLDQQCASNYKQNSFNILRGPYSHNFNPYIHAATPSLSTLTSPNL